MGDYFAWLGLPRRPWIEEELLKDRFLKLSNEYHPDRHHESGDSNTATATSQFQDLNAAYACLRDPKSRILHLIELEAGRRPREVQEIPEEATQLFVEVGTLCAGVDQHLKRSQQVVSPLIKVKHFRESMEWVEQVKSVLAKLERWRNGFYEKLRQMNTVWSSRSPESGPKVAPETLPLEELERCYRLLSYESRWHSQLQERLFRLSTPL